MLIQRSPSDPNCILNIASFLTLSQPLDAHFWEGCHAHYVVTINDDGGYVIATVGGFYFFLYVLFLWFYS